MSSESSSAEPKRVEPKVSKAAQLWVAVLLGVLFVLFLETRGNHTQTMNFVVNTDADDVGAEVLVDNKRLGAVENSTADGPGGGVFLGYLPRGNHHVEVRKSGFKPYGKDIDMQQEQYLGVDLEPLSK
ncbi:MAG TPA: carboxypeptidase-like regulatory domain-containing protein [Drouetiella sp.]